MFLLKNFLESFKMAQRSNITNMFTSMGFDINYINRAFKVYEQNYDQKYNVQVMTEIIVKFIN